MPNDQQRHQRPDSTPSGVSKLLWTLGIVALVPLSLAAMIYVVMGLFYTLNGEWVDGLATMSVALIYGLPALIIGFILLQDLPKK